MILRMAIVSALITVSVGCKSESKSCAEAFTSSDCEGAQLCVCESAKRIAGSDKHMCVGKDDRPAGRCVSRVEALRRGQKAYDRLVDKLCACQTAQCAKELLPRNLETITPAIFAAYSLADIASSSRATLDQPMQEVATQFEASRARQNTCNDRWDDEDL